MATETTDAGHGAAEASAGMPQLEFGTFPNQIFWLVVALVVIFFVLTRVALPRIAGVLAERQEAEEAYNVALAEARVEAQKIAAEAKAEIQAELDTAQAKADAEIAAKAAESEAAIAEIRAGAVEAVKTVAKDTAGEILSSIGVKADAGTITSAITARMKG